MLKYHLEPLCHLFVWLVVFFIYLQPNCDVKSYK